MSIAAQLAAANPELKTQKTGPWRFKAFAKVPAAQTGHHALPHPAQHHA